MSIVVCIGSGNMGAALMKGACAVGRTRVASGNIFFTDADMEKARSLAADLKANVIESNIEAVKKGDFIFLAVKPQVLPQVLAEIAAAVKERLNSGDLPVFVSMAAGWTIARIKASISVKLPVARIMPNTPALIGKGMIAMAASPEVSAQSVSEIEKLLSGAGIIDKVEERFMDAVTGLSGSGPAFVYLFIEALADGGVRAGLPRNGSGNGKTPRRIKGHGNVSGRNDNCRPCRSGRRRFPWLCDKSRGSRVETRRRIELKEN